MLYLSQDAKNSPTRSQDLLAFLRAAQKGEAAML
jgi:hypothetical protein